MERKNIKKDSLFNLTIGEYDTYSHIGLYRALTDIDLEKSTKAFNQYIKTNKDIYADDFDEWIIENKYAEKVETTNLHILEWYIGAEFRLEIQK